MENSLQLMEKVSPGEHEKQRIWDAVYPLVICYITIENHNFVAGKIHELSMVMFNSYFDITRPGMSRHLWFSYGFPMIFL